MEENGECKPSAEYQPEEPEQKLEKVPADMCERCSVGGNQWMVSNKEEQFHPSKQNTRCRARFHVNSTRGKEQEEGGHNQAEFEPVFEVCEV